MDESLFISTARRASKDFYLIPLEDSKFSTGQCNSLSYTVVESLSSSGAKERFRRRISVKCNQNWVFIVLACSL